MDIYDIAKKSGYSTATVSRVINNSKNVSDKARKIIEDIINESGYKPNRVARSLARSSTQMIGIMVPDIRGYFESQAAFELEMRLDKLGYTTILCVTTDKLNKKLDYLDVLIENKVEAVIGVGSTYEEEGFYSQLDEVAESFPIALLNVRSQSKSNNMVHVYIDEIEATKQAVKLLHKRSYKKPLYVSLDTGYVSRSYIAKKAGFIEGIYEYYADTADFVEFKVKDLDKDLARLVDFLRENDSFDCLQFEIDSLAVRAYKVLANEGFDIPNKMGIIGFDNILVTNFTNLSITTVDQRISDQVAIAVENLMKLLNNEKAQINNVLEAKLVEKETTLRDKLI